MRRCEIPLSHRIALALVVVALGGGCALPDPQPGAREEAAKTQPAAATRAPAPAALAGPAPPAPTAPSGRTSDPGSRYLSAGVTGALTVETPPPAPSGVAAAP